MMDTKIIQVALDGLDNILKVGEMDRVAGGPGTTNQFAQFVEEAGGMLTIHNLQQHDNLEVYKKAFNIMDKYFPDEDEVDTNISNRAFDDPIGSTYVVSGNSFMIDIPLSKLPQFHQDVRAPQGGFSFNPQ